MRPLRSFSTRILPVVLALVLAGIGCTGGGVVDRTEPSLPVTASASAGEPSFPVTITDDDGERVTIAAEPRRIVTFAPSMTEIVFALGLGDRIVGVSGPYDDYPLEARQIEQVGGAGDFGVDPNVETVVALEPDLFLTIAGGDEWKQRLRELGVPVVTLNATDVPDLLSDIRAVGEVTGANAAAVTLTSDMQARVDAVAAQVVRRVPCFFEVYYAAGTLTTVGPHTFVFDLLERAGCDPVTAEAKSDYPNWSVDALVAERPEVYIATPESAKNPGAIAKRPGFGGIPAVEDSRILLVDGDLVTRPGPRVVDGLEQLAGAIAGSWD